MTGSHTTQRDRFDSLSVLEATPVLGEFNRAGVLDPIDVHAATTIGDLFGTQDESVLLAAALTVRGTRFGHVCIDLATVRESVSIDGVPTDVVGSLPWPDPDRWLADTAASPIIGDGAPDRPLILDGTLLYLERFWAYESAVADRLLARAETSPLELEGLAEPVARLFPGAASLQRAAAVLGATGRVTVIAGGPGTGKTHTIARTLGVLFEQAETSGSPAPFVAVAAPTGKAAARLTEQIREFAASDLISQPTRDRLSDLEASTLHRLLGWHPSRNRFRHSASDPLPYDTVIVDEMSMVSLPMTAKLLDAVHPEARLILVGDPDQLVSIEAGTVLGDLVGPAADGPLLSPEARARLTETTGDELSGGAHPALMADHVVTLEAVFRFGVESPIGNLAGAIRTGDADRALDHLLGDREGLVWHEVSAVEAEETDGFIAPLLEHAHRLVELGESGDAEGALDELERIALLCAHRRGEHGVEHWVPWIESRVRGRGSERWYPGRPVMVTTNDYRLGVFNGDIGVTVRDGGRLVTAFRGSDGVKLIGPAQLPSLETVHAMTIHKSQGSQFDQVTVMIPGEDSRLLTRELLYTAVTRAKQHVTIVGTELAIRAAIDRRVARSSGLGQKLWAGPSGAE